MARSLFDPDEDDTDSGDDAIPLLPAVVHASPDIPPINPFHDS